MIDPIEFGKAMGGIVRDAMAPLLKRVEALEARQPERGEKGDRGADGKSVTLDDLADPISEMIRKAVAALPAPKDGEAGPQGVPGEKGADGKDAEPIDLADVAAEILSTDALKTLVELHVADAVQKYFEANPIQHGKDGAVGPQGERGQDGAKGDKGDKGEDGIGLAGAVVNRSGELVITTTKGEALTLGPVVGRDGAPGRDGADLSSPTFEWEGRTCRVKAQNGEVMSSYTFPIPLDAGYWRDGMKCQPGDIVTQDGSAWICLKETADRPSYQNKTEWRMFARKGRDGDKGEPGGGPKPVEPVKLND